jgi:fibro-slime domain-containing protein
VLALLALAQAVACGAGGEDKSPAKVNQLAPEGGRSGPSSDTPSGGTFVMEECTGPSCDIASTTADLPGPPGCGDGVRTDDEACDDGNKVSGDGCAGNCLATESGYSCAAPNQPCRRIARCGDGVVADTEQCDDGNTVSDDGCSNRCRVELGSKCAGAPSVCTPTICGDGIKEGAEACDDGNTEPFDGCSSNCLKEPNCQGAACTSECGDGLVLGEECDDGNLIDGDGCSSSCTRETGFTCLETAPCEQINGECVLRVPAVFRDFPATQPDFIDGQNSCTALTRGTVNAKLDGAGRPVLNANSPNLAQACLSTPANFSAWYTDHPGEVTVVGELVLFDNHNGGYVNRYGADGTQWKYIAANTERGAAGGCNAACLNEAQNSQGPYQGMPTLRCADNCRGANDAILQLTNGDLQRANQALTQARNANPPVQATITAATAQVAAVQAQLATLVAAADKCETDCQVLVDARVTPCLATCNPCSYDATQSCLGGREVSQDGTPVFFPVDGVTGPTANQVRATIPAQYGYSSFPAENTVIPNAPLHNFYFTTDVEYWFTYDANMRATLTFLGDDDVWVFINGNLAVDLGGLHVPSTGSVTIDAAAGTVISVTQDGRGLETTPPSAAAPVTTRSTPAAFGLTAGNVYKISIFHAERKITGSSFQLTLAGFNARPSDCSAVCGDGVLSFGEECDDMVNDGGYGECGPDCKLGPFCGDKIVQQEYGETCDVGPGGDSTCRGCRVIKLR